MGYETMWEDTDPCRCGRGTIVSRFEMDDWNRTRRTWQTRCPVCFEEDRTRRQAEQRAEEQRDQYFQQARVLAENRYMQTWLDRFTGISAKVAWLLYTGGSGYPCLGTFYKHAKWHGGVIEYMRWRFR